MGFAQRTLVHDVLAEQFGTPVTYASITLRSVQQSRLLLAANRGSLAVEDGFPEKC